MDQKRDAPKDLDLQEGEMICDKCNGSGMGEKSKTMSGEIIYYNVCPKCQGAGKVDWIENVIGKKPKNNSSSSGIFSTGGWSDASWQKASGKSGNLMNESMKLMAEKMAKEIDDEILKSITKAMQVPYNEL